MFIVSHKTAVELPQRKFTVNFMELTDDLLNSGTFPVGCLVPYCHKSVYELQTVIFLGVVQYSVMESGR